MKRLFQRKSSSGASPAGDAPPPPSSSSPTPARDDESTSSGGRRSYSPERRLPFGMGGSRGSPGKTRAQSAAPVRPPAPPPPAAASPPLPPPSPQEQQSPPPPPTTATDEQVHALVVAYVTSTAEVDQIAAIRAIRAALTGAITISEGDAHRLLSIGAQRLRQRCQRQLEAFNASLLRGSGSGGGGGHTAEGAPSSTTSSDASRWTADVGGDDEAMEATLEVLETMLRRAPASESAILVVSERLPSTLVKMLKAHATPPAMAIPETTLVRILGVLDEIVRFPAATQELVETSTWHRLLHVRLPESLHHHPRVLELIRNTVLVMTPSAWRTVAPHLHEHGSVGSLLDLTEDMKSLEMAVIIGAHILRSMFELEMLDLHHQLQRTQFYGKLFAAYGRASADQGLTREDSSEVASFVAALDLLCQSGSAGALSVGEMVHDECFRLVSLDPTSVRSYLNLEAFAVVVDILNDSVKRWQSDGQTPLSGRWEHLQCQLIQLIGRLVTQNTCDYVFVRRAEVIQTLLGRLDELPEISKHSVGTILAAIAIEASVVPTSELTVIKQAIEGPTLQSCDAIVLLGFIANLLRFNDCYRRVLVHVGVLGAILSLFRAQVIVSSNEAVASTKINLAYPTSTVRASNRHLLSSDDHNQVTDKGLISFLTSHCRQSSVVRKVEPLHQLDGTTFLAIIDVLTLFADSASPHGQTAAEEELLKSLCHVTTLECVCILLADQRRQQAGLKMWLSILKITLLFTKQNTSLYNTVNCLLQAIRYVTLSVYYRSDTDIIFAFEPSEQVLLNGLRCISEMLQPTNSPSSQVLSASNRDRILVAVYDAGGLLTALAALNSLMSNGDKFNSDTTAQMAIVTVDLVHMFINCNSNASDMFNRAVTFGYLSELLDRAFESVRNDRGLQCVCLLRLVSSAVNQYWLFRPPAGLDKQLPDIGGEAEFKLVQPGAMAAFFQLLSLWSDNINSTNIFQLLHICSTILESKENARIASNARLGEVLLRAFAQLQAAQDKSSTFRQVRCSLMDPDSPFHSAILGILERIASAGLSHKDVCRWIKLLVMGSQSGGNCMVSQQVPLLNLLVKIVCATSSQDVPAIRFSVSDEGFASIQIPEVYSRSNTVNPSQSVSALASLAQNTKMWPPADGYTVMVWIRIDASETKEAREKHYWNLLMQNKCVLCQQPMRDDYALKCSHKACRGCHEALISCGGECVVCNAPMFYLYRYRSSDSKSISEVFVKGSRLYMRTSATKTVYQFGYQGLHVGQWYHIAIVHSKQRFQSSHASLYVNGILQETVKMSYPSSASIGQPLSGAVGVPAQARRTSTCCWSVGPICLLDDVITQHLINCVFAAGPRYDFLFFGAAGNSDVAVSLDHLYASNLQLLDEYTRDPIRTLIESVDAERVSRSSLLRGSLSLASAASSAAAAIVQDMKLQGSSIFSHIASAAPLVNIPISQERILLAFSPRNAIGDGMTVIPNSKLDGRPLAQIIGGASVLPSTDVADVLFEVCGSAPRFAYIILEQTRSSRQVVEALQLLSSCIYCHPRNLEAMETEHGYGIVNYLLHQKCGLLGDEALHVLFHIVGIDIGTDNDSPLHGEPRPSAIRNLFALQHFLLDYSLWQKVSTSTQRLLFSSLYSCLVTGDESLRERNRIQLQSLSLVRQLLYVFLDPNVEMDLLRVIVDLILVCLSGASKDANVEGNFADVASFLVSTLSPRFIRGQLEENSAILNRSAKLRKMRAESAGNKLAIDSPFKQPSVSMGGSVARLCLSPRGKRNQWSFKHASLEGSKEVLSEWRYMDNPVSNHANVDSLNAARLRARQSHVQDLLLDILCKAVQKLDLKESKEKDVLDLYNESSGVTGESAGSNIGNNRMQLPSSSKLTGFRRVLSPRWIGYFLFPTVESSCSVAVAPSTVVLALKLLSILLARQRYETAFRKDGYYRLLAQGLPCDHNVFNATATLARETIFPFDQLWYTLFCIVLGTPVDGVPHEIQFKMFFLSKDFELNVQRNRIQNASIIWVILALLRRHYNDPVLFSTLRSIRISPEKSVMEQVAHTLYRRIPLESLHHLEVLDFLHHLYDTMPAFKKLLLQGGDKYRMELIDELSMLTCSAARASVLLVYAPTEKKVHQSLLSNKRDLSGHEFATCVVTLAEESAANDDSDGSEDPFQHPVSVRAMRLLVAVLMDFLISHPNGVDIIEAFFEAAHGSTLAPPLHEGLQLRFETLIMMSLLEQIRAKFSEESFLTENKSFALNLKDFLKLVVRKMQLWQRSQHGDGCPRSFRCCDRFHFAGGPFLLLDLSLFVLGETTVGITSSGSGPSSLLSTLINEKLNKGKKRRQFRQMLGRMNISKSAELEGLTAGMYVALNAVVLHMIEGHGSEVNDDELETLLHLIHIHREVVLGARNSQDKDFFVCLCRFLLQMVSNPSTHTPLLQVSIHLWIDLMYFQRSLMTEMLTVEIRRSGTQYSVNLLKNGFDVLLECPDDNQQSPTKPLVDSQAFAKFKHWVELVGPPLKELENNLDRVYLKSALQMKETIREAWSAYKKRSSQRKAKEAKRFTNRVDWFIAMEREYFETLTEVQHNEFRRQLKWRQDRVDRQKFIARQWQQLRLNLMEHSLGPDMELVIRGNKALMTKIIQSSRLLHPATSKTWQLDATEGPHRMRKRFFLKMRPPTESRIPINVTMSPQKSELPVRFARRFAVLGQILSVSRVCSRSRRRRFSDSDLRAFNNAVEECGSIGHDNTHAISNTSNTMVQSDGASSTNSPTRRASFQAIQHRDRVEESQRSQDGSQLVSKKRKNSFATDNDSGDEVDSDEETGIFDREFNAGEDSVDEKLRPLLEPGDEIMDMYDCLRVDGMDACPGIFIICNDHLYIVDNYQLAVPYGPASRSQRNTGNSETRVIEVSVETPTRLERRLSLRFQLPYSDDEDIMNTGVTATPSSLTIQRSSSTHQCRSWSYDDVVELHKRRHQLRHVAIELFAHDGRNYLITFESNQQRENVFHSLLAKCPNVRGAANGMERSAASADLYSQLKKLLRQNMTERWINRDITNFEYLMHLNTLAGRSYNDLTQYPVFPWVLADYTSAVLDLHDPASFRDLSKPMGALCREEEFRARYESLSESTDENDPLSSKPFHYGTHYSSAGIVLHYLMRIEPFTTHFLRLQGGKFDHADRLFASIAGAWKSAAGLDTAQSGTQDVKELIPEFFYLPAFLKNMNEREFGKDQSGIVVSDVELPPWANGSAREFVRINREALESHHVSEHLHHWIDLIFGYKQQGPAAVEACNVFYHLTYEGAVDLDGIKEPAMKRAIIDQISEFGQTPSQLFKTPHPPRIKASSSTTTASANTSLSTSLGPSTPAGDGNVAAMAPQGGGPLSASVSSRPALTNSFLEGTDLVSRMHSILANTGLGGGTEDSTFIIDHAGLLQQEPRRELAANPLVTAYRGQALGSVGPSTVVTSTYARPRLLSSGLQAAPIQQIATTVGTVTREERAVLVSEQCLLIPPKYHEFLAWGFQDRSLKLLTVGATETGGGGGDSRVVLSMELEFAIGVACITSEGRTFVAGAAHAPVLRLWQFSSRRALMTIGNAHRKRAYSVGVHSTGHGVRSIAPLVTLSTAAHDGAITAVAVCRAHSVLVSGCAAGVAVLWDLNRLRFICVLPALLQDGGTDKPAAALPIAAVAISRVSGDITVACGAVFGVYDLNGTLLVRLTPAMLQFDAQLPRAPITALAVNASEASEWAREKAVLTGHADGLVCVWAYAHTGAHGDGDGAWAIDLKGRHTITRASTSASSTSTTAMTRNAAAVTALYLTRDERKLFTGTADGLLSVWTPALDRAPATTASTALHALASPGPMHPAALV